MDNRDEAYTKYNSYLSLLRTLRFEEDEIYSLSWSSDGRFLAAIGYDETLHILPVDRSGLAYQVSSDIGYLSSIAWSAGGSQIALAGPNGLVIRDAQDTSIVNELYLEKLDVNTCVAWSTTDDRIAVGANDGSILVFRSDQQSSPDRIFPVLGSSTVGAISWCPKAPFFASLADGSIVLTEGPLSRGTIVHGNYSDIAWTPDGNHLLAVDDGAIDIFGSSLRLERRIEGHPGAIKTIAVSMDGLLFAAASASQLRIYRWETGEVVFVYRKPADRSKVAYFAFDPTGPRIAIHTSNGIDVVQFNPLVLSTVDPAIPSIHYRNAKVVLVGDSGVGKSGLGLVLSGEPFRATESTHGRHICLLDSVEMDLDRGWTELRETYLWDLAGQPGYRLIHQMHLDEIETAIVIFDASNALDPFAGVNYWVRALHQAARRLGTNRQAKLLLVSARADRGSIRAHISRIEEFVRRHGFVSYIETSAKDGRNIPELLNKIKNSIEWPELPQVTSTKLFHSIREFLISYQKSGLVLLTEPELYRAFEHGAGSELNDDELEVQFETCLRLAHSQGLVNLFSFGGLVLLRPELIDSYASALIDAAQREPDGLGCISEDNARAARFDIPEDDRLSDRTTEQFLCTAMVEELIKNEIVLVEYTDMGQQLVFPSQATREHPEMPDPPGKSIIVGFSGAVENVYATLIVRLTHSGQYSINGSWRNATTFAAKIGGQCGIYLSQRQEDSAEFHLFFDESASKETQFQFEEYVVGHLQRRAVAESTWRRRLFKCLRCDTPISDEQAAKRSRLGHQFINCNVCGASVSLADGQSRIRHELRATVREMNEHADEQRDIEAALISASGEMQGHDFREWAGSDRPTLAVVFTDIKGSTASQLNLGNQRWRSVIKDHFERGEILVANRGGYNIKRIGDSLMAAFHNAVYSGPVCQDSFRRCIRWTARV